MKGISQGFFKARLYHL